MPPAPAAAAPNHPAPLGDAGRRAMPLPALRPGDTVAVVAPAGPAADGLVDQVPGCLRDQGYVPRLYPGCHGRHGLYAAPDAQRLADLQHALDDPTVAAVWCLRGGYGSNRLLHRLDLRGLQTRPKLLIGYSDITALHCALDRAGLPALHAPMPASDLLRPGREADADALWALLREGVPAGTTWAPPLLPDTWRVPGQARGRLAGGNLCTLATLAGTPWALRPQGRVLFLEDVGEAPYRVDRLLWQLRASGGFEGLAGVLLGSFTEAEDATELLREHLGTLGIPVLAGWPCGHGTPHRPLPLGALVTLDATAGTLRFDEDVLCP